MALAEIAAGAAAAVLAGRSALPRARGLSPVAFAEDFVLGLALVVPLAFVAGVLGLPWSPLSMPVLALVLAGLLRLADSRGAAAATVPSTPAGWVARAALGLAAAAFLVAAWKWLRAPLWSWDHFAIWGVKARRLVQDGALDLEFLKLRKFVRSNPDYPIGFPLACRFLSPSVPGMAEFRLIHALFAGSLAAAVYGAARRLEAPPAVSALAAAVLSASPLFWDTEAVGLADLPMVCVATVAVRLVLQSRDDARFPAWTAGAALGFLGWMKTEGFVLGALLALFAAVLLRNGRRGGGDARVPLLSAWLAWSLGALAVRRWWLVPGIGFFEGDWADRVGARVRSTGTLLSAMLGNLGGAEWLGIWYLFAAAVTVALVLRAPEAGLLGLAVLGQFGFYAFVYLGTYLDPLEHVESSFHRLAAAVAPLALLAVAAAVAALLRPRGREAEA